MFSFFRNRRWSQPSRSKNKNDLGKHKSIFRPTLELLEDRVTPTTFTWIGTSITENQWENASNWQGGGAGAYPGWSGTAATINDVAIINGDSIYDCPIMQTAHEVAELQISGGLLTLSAELTINDGASVTGGQINGSIDVTGGTLNWTGSCFNYQTPAAGTLTISDNAVGQLIPTSNGGNFFGDNIDVDGPAGQLFLGSFTCCQTITITNDGLMNIWGAGEMSQLTRSRTTIQNNGCFSDGASGTFTMAASVVNTGTMMVYSGSTLSVGYFLGGLGTLQNQGGNLSM
jgi:hypothetical protein